jgi:hypothetical protein
LLLVVTQKSGRATSVSSRLSLPSAPTMVIELLRPNGGLASTTLGRRPSARSSASRTSIGLSSPGCTMPCSTMFIAASRAVPSTSSTPRTKPLRSRSRSSGVSGPLLACR